MVPWRCSVRTAAPTRGARCGRFRSAIMRSLRPNPHPYPLPPPTPGGGSNTISGRSAPIPIPTPTPGLFGLPPPTPGGGFENFKTTIPHIYCLSVPMRGRLFAFARPTVCLQAALRFGLQAGARPRKGYRATQSKAAPLNAIVKDT